MTDVAAPASGEARGLSREVIWAALATAAGMTPGLMGFVGPAVPTGAVQGLGWPAFGVAAALLLDRDPQSRLGKSFTALAALPFVITAAALATAGEQLPWLSVERFWDALGIAPLIAALTLITWSVGIAPDRMARRRLVWLVVLSAALVAAVITAATSAGSRAAAVVTALGLSAMAGVIFRLVTAKELRPISEPLMDAAIALATVLCGAGAGAVVRIAGERAGIPGPDLSGAFAAVVTAGLVIPAALWFRRLFLQRRYGHGLLSAADVAAITADLHTLGDARDLLGKAAAMVAAASGHRSVSLVLGPDSPELPPHWVLYPLVVGGHQAGTLFLEPDHPEGPEPRQQRTITQLLPTVALVAKAVSLAVEAEYARKDAARQREAERARILGDLHDGLGPVLVGMSMRVRAELRHNPAPLLQTLANDLAQSRKDLRRIVSGLTPSALDNRDLPDALQRLVGALSGNGPTIAMQIDLNEEAAPETAAAVYRSVAEGISNALRHAQAQHVSVTVSNTAGGTIQAAVTDDGAGGPIIYGVGLSSLHSRAQELGGTMHIVHEPGTGTRLQVELPVGSPAR